MSSSSLTDPQSKTAEMEHREMAKATTAGSYNLTEQDERAIALKLARQADPGLSYASWRGLKFIFLALVICMCSGDNGKCGCGVGGVNPCRQRIRTRRNLS